MANEIAPAGEQKNMPPADYVRQIIPGISDDEAHFCLLEFTPWPLIDAGDELRQAIEAYWDGRQEGKDNAD